MSKIKEVNIDGTQVFMKKTREGYRVIHPMRINGKINWKNFLAGGSWYNLLGVAIIVFIVLGCINEYSNAVEVANQCMQSNPIYNLLGGIN